MGQVDPSLPAMAGQGGYTMEEGLKDADTSCRRRVLVAWLLEAEGRGHKRDFRGCVAQA